MKAPFRDGSAPRRSAGSHWSISDELPSYPNGKIFVGQDLTGSVSYFGSANSRLIEADFTPDQCRDLTVRKEILWESQTATNQEVNAKEVEFILKLGSNDPAVGYNRRPKFRSQQ